MSGKKLSELMENVKMSEDLKKKIAEENRQHFNNVKKGFNHIYGALIDATEKSGLNCHEVLVAMTLARVSIEYEYYQAGLSESDFDLAEDDAFAMIDGEIASHLLRRANRGEDDEMLFDDDEDDDDAADDEN